MAAVRAVVVQDLRGPGSALLKEVPEPTGSHPRANGRRLLVEVHAAGLSFIDPLQTRGLYQNGVPAPYVCGSELAGVVIEADSECGVEAGDRVSGIVWHGALAERALAIPEYLIRLPDHVTFVEGAAIYMNYSTAWYALDRAALRAGETVLVHGAAGGVGTAAVDLAGAFGSRVIAVVSSDAKAAVAERQGAYAIVRSDGQWLQQVRDLTGGRGADVVVDPVGGDRFTDSLRSLRIGGRLVVVGFAGGSIPTVKVNRLLHRNLTITGITMDVMEEEHPGTLARVRSAIERLLAAGRVHPVIGSVFPLEEAPTALRSMEERRAIGKVVVRVAG
jgi:NADPH2:quinone reductase